MKLLNYLKITNKINQFFAVDARLGFLGLFDGALAGRPPPVPFFLLSSSFPLYFPTVPSLAWFRSNKISSRRCFDLAAN